MNIGIYISPAHPVPPDADKILAPWVLTKELADLLVERGNQVTLFAAMGSSTKARLCDFGISPLVRKEQLFSADDYISMVNQVEQDFFQSALVKSSQDGIEVLHIEQPVETFYPQIADRTGKTPLVFTFHDPIKPKRWEILGKLKQLPNVYFVGISQAQFVGVPFKSDATVYNGVSLSLFPFNKDLDKSAMYLSVGRIVPSKGYEDAIAAVHAVGGRLMIAGQVYPDQIESQSFFDQKIKPFMDGGTVFLEPVLRRDHLVGHYQTARALLFPIKWEEPFGLVMIEAMACGTPVIAYNRGSVSEIVKDGVTGFIVEENNTNETNQNTNRTNNLIIKKTGIEGLVEAIKRIGEIDRAACRRHVEENFSIEKMAQGYEAVYKRVVGCKNFVVKWAGGSIL